MKVLSLLCLSYFFIVNVKAQVSDKVKLKLRPELSLNYMQDSKLVGLGVTQGLHYNLNKKEKIALSFTFAYAEGNRNFKTSPDRLPNVEFGDYSPRYQTLIGGPFSWDHPIELDVKTATTYQYSLNFSYLRKAGAWEWGGGVYLTYINKSYLAALIPDFDIEFAGRAYSIDFFVPFHVRYYDAGPFVTAARRINHKRAKLPVYVTSTVYLALKNNHVYHLGLAVDL